MGWWSRVSVKMKYVLVAFAAVTCVQREFRNNYLRSSRCPCCGTDLSPD